jgi:uncharacterized protein
LLARAEVGRLAVAVHGDPEIFPVNFVIDNRTVLFRTAEGTKLASIAVSARVAFEVDGFDTATGEAWSFVVRGTPELLEQLNDGPGPAAVPLGRNAEAGLRPDHAESGHRTPVHRSPGTRED